MEAHCTPLSWSNYFCQDEGIEELRHYLVYTTELESAILSAKEEITRREFEIFNLKDLLSKSIKEKTEVQAQCQRLMWEKLLLQQQLSQKQQEEQQQQQTMQEQEIKTVLLRESATASENDSKGSDSTDSTTITVVASQFKADPVPQQPPLILESELPEVILKLAAERPLPEKGKLLQAVKDAGPLLQTLLLAGPLPQWQHPPPQLDSIEIPPVTISSPTARLIHQDSFKKRSHECLDSSSPPPPPPNKYQKAAALH